MLMGKLYLCIDIALPYLEAIFFPLNNFFSLAKSFGMETQQAQ